MNKHFVLVINSLDYYQRFGTTSADQSYIFNNSNIPSGKYRCRFSYRSGQDAITTYNTWALIGLRTGSFVSTYSVGATGGLQASSLIGSTQQIQNPAGTASYYYAGCNDNAPFYINYNPSSEIRITLYSAGNLGTLFTGTSHYVLMIEMERLDDDE